MGCVIVICDNQIVAISVALLTMCIPCPVLWILCPVHIVVQVGHGPGKETQALLSTDAVRGVLYDMVSVVQLHISLHHGLTL
jgi:hypothetical protein